MNDIDKDAEHLEFLFRHISNVQGACKLLAQRLIALERPDFARILIANSLSHDKSKFLGLEWDNLRVGMDPEKLREAHYQHTATNGHHPEFYGGIENMPELAIAELVADWYSRSAEIGTDLRIWIKKEATKKFNFSLNGKTYKQIKRFVDLLLEPTMGDMK